MILGGHSTRVEEDKIHINFDLKNFNGIMGILKYSLWRECVCVKVLIKGRIQ
jgi:hypothetical protein